ncbi:hypothetical protein FQU75_00040 [Paenibacillus polymyxa]|nr:hypothetical protein FQU75_00040 [Paenibacillus polymyxa]
MGKLKPISKTDKRMLDISITLDNQGRISLNSDFRKEINMTGKESLYVFYDEDGQRIGIAKQCDAEDIEPHSFDGRGYCQAKAFLSWCGFNFKDGAIRMLFEGMEDGIYVFAVPGRRHVELKLGKNGDLERR